jgi:hypothetical protein
MKQRLLADGGVAQSGSGGGGAPSAPAATSQTQTVSTIAPWAQPGVSNIINQQMANMFPNATTNADGSINLGQQKGYTAFGENGAGVGPNQIAAAQKAVAGFSPLQQMAQQGVAGMQMPGQFGTATNMASAAGQNLMNSATPAMAYGNLGSAMGTAAANMAPQAQQYGQAGANIGTQGGLGYGAQGFQAGQGAAGYGAMGAGQGASYGQNAQNAAAVQSYMNPYLRATLDPAMQLQQQQFGQINAQNQGQATQQGAFGGGRQAVTQGLNQQNQMLAQNQLTGQAYNQAYNTANQNMQQAAALGMQGANLGIQGQQAAIQGANTGLQGVGQALAGQQLGLSGLNTANTLYNTGISGAQTGLAGVNAAQAGYTGANQAAQNLGNLGTQQQAAQMGIYNAQNALGKEQQGNQQAVINQAIQNYANNQNYPMQQAYNLVGLYTGAPTAQTQTRYDAPPSAVNTMANAAVGTYAASKLVAKGGLMKTKDMAAGGIASYGIGGVTSSLENMTAQELQKEIKTSSSPFVREKATELLNEKMAGEMVGRQRGAGIGAKYNYNGAGGGIVAFAEGKTVEDKDAPSLTGVDKKLVSKMDLLRNEYGYGQPSAEDIAIREEIKQERAAAKENAKNIVPLALLSGAGKGLQNTSPFAGPGIGAMMEGAAGTYAKGQADYDAQLKALRSGELDLSKLSSTDRNNLLHYAMSGASAEQTAEDAALSRIEAAKLRKQTADIAALSRNDTKWQTLYGKLYSTNVDAAQADIAGKRKLTQEELNTIAGNTMLQVDEILKAGGGKGLNIAGKDGTGGGSDGKIPPPPPGYKVPGAKS